jgi:hypothetical protein
VGTDDLREQVQSGPDAGVVLVERVAHLVGVPPAKAARVAGDDHVAQAGG